MSAPDIHLFNHHAMATWFQVRIAGGGRDYAAQAAQAAFALADELESLLSRFRENSEISRIAQLRPGEKIRLCEPVFACLEIARRMEQATFGAFSISPAALNSQPAMPRWSLLPDEFAIRCETGRLEFDPGAIGKGFALDRMAEVLREWDCPSFLIVAGGSSVLAGEPPEGSEGWACGLGDEDSRPRKLLANASMSGSGQGVKGLHIIDPRTGRPVSPRPRVWATAPTAAESDALSTACMVLNPDEIASLLSTHEHWAVYSDSGRL